MNILLLLRLTLELEINPYPNASETYIKYS